MPTFEDIRLGQQAVAHGLAQPLEIEECLSAQHNSEQNGNNSRLGEILIERGFITKSQLERLLSMQQESVQKVTRIGNYELIRKLGEGGMGAVYQARDALTNEIVALKVLPRSRARDSTFLRRFESEARAAFEIDHPNIVKGLDVDHADGYHFLVMEYIEGKDIYSLLEQKGRFPEHEALRILEQMASALKYIFEEQLVHRDIKPENILVTEDGIAKLTDLGLAVDKETQGRARITKVGIAMGTPFYLSPEQIQGKSEIDIRSDIYSLGATVYEMVTGKPPFDGENASVVMMKHLNEQVPSPKEIDHDITLGFCHVLEKSMAKDPAERYQTPLELLDDLLLLAAGENPRSVRPMEGRSSIARPASERTKAHRSRIVPALSKDRLDIFSDQPNGSKRLGTRSSSSRSSVIMHSPSVRRLPAANGSTSRHRGSTMANTGIKWAFLAGMFVALLAFILFLLFGLLGGQNVN